MSTLDRNLFPVLTALVAAADVAIALPARAAVKQAGKEVVATITWRSESTQDTRVDHRAAG
jgi:hypothetical protein